MQLLQGRVRHTRLVPVRHHFEAPTWCLLLPMRRLRAQPDPLLPRNRFGWLSFHDADHGDGRTDSLAWLEELLAREGIEDADGEVWLQAYPRILGHAFKPVSFWYCERADGSLAAVVAEVNNTFGERHCYLLQGAGLAGGTEVAARKVFHVSPFCRVEGAYRFRFLHRPAQPGAAARRLVRIDLDAPDGTPLLQTSVSGMLWPLTAASRRAVLWRQPLLSLGVVARIHWQALRLWRKRLPFFRKPAPPAAFVTR